MERFEISEGLDIHQLNIDEKNFAELVELVLLTFNKLGINPEEKSVCYQRFSDGKSILAIKVLEGVEENKDNYMFIGCDAIYYDNDVSCNVYMHAEAPAGIKSVNISNLIARKIVNFFESVEKDLFERKMQNLEVFFKIPLVKESQKELIIKEDTKKIGQLRKVVKNIFGRKNENK